MIVSADALLQQDRHIVPVTRENNAVFRFTLGVTDLYEILVPTCSYRMGTKRIGFGYAVIGEKFKLGSSLYGRFFCRKQRTSLHCPLVSVQVSSAHISGGFSYYNCTLCCWLFLYEMLFEEKSSYFSKT